MKKINVVKVSAEIRSRKQTLFFFPHREHIVICVIATGLILGVEPGIGLLLN